ncbi:FIST N-terminal domain-containing protein [Hyphomicrobium sp.]|uniref:FIST N-terminal domain-containing protein n=1 Tax=Hyphomicrobium sp. TaxID=82 RepID=UPI0025C142D1|nr:FIST N-terminal domain-containing protein [Hyphomicrobium sp.]MCC7254235.1 FIST C-terminal domain-containing protein [Hyphomicrobium sp.]
MSELRAALTGDFQHIIAFFSVDYDPAELAAALGNAFKDVTVSGCSTSGGIGPGGLMETGVLLIAFPRQGFRIHSGVIEDVGAFGVERASGIVRELKARMRVGERGQLAERVFGVMLVDGLSNAEEPLVAAVHWAFGDMQLVGGSAGDGLAFRQTSLIHDGRVLTRSAILMMVESDYPFRIFKTSNFEPTQIKLVVTAADTQGRMVQELNAEPAAREYASAIGLLPDELGPFSFASYPLVVKVGGDYYCRSIRNMNPDGSLSFFCAIDEGLVFTVARPKDMLSSTERTLQDIEHALGGIDLVVGFDCVLRRLDAENRQVRRQMEDLYRNFRVVGFHTYGEQHNAMHLNQTLTGVAFGPRREIQR